MEKKVKLEITTENCEYIEYEDGTVMRFFRTQEEPEGENVSEAITVSAKIRHLRIRATSKDEKGPFTNLPPSLLGS